MAHSSSAKSGGTLSVRAGVSPKLLARKSADRSAGNASGETIEASFPTAATAMRGVATPGPAADSPSESPQGAARAVDAAASALGQRTPPTWSDEDESGFQALSTRRKAAGVRRTAQAGAQLVQPGSIKPNPNTVVAVIVGLFGDKVAMTRGDLIAAMTSATFPHPKARPADPSWCQGYVAGAIRSGFLMVAPAQAAPAIEHSVQSEPDSSITAELERSAAGA